MQNPIIKTFDCSGYIQATIVAAYSGARNIRMYGLCNAGIVGSSPVRGMDVLCVYSVFAFPPVEVATL
jgi:hypothetical protein